MLQYILERGELKAEGLATGLAEGMNKSKIEIAERLLAEKVELAFIVKVTGLPLAQIQAIQKHR